MSTKDKEWDELIQGADSENVIMSDDLIARVHPYNIELNDEIPSIVDPSLPIATFVFEDYRISGNLISYSSNSSQTSFVLSLPSTSASSALLSSALKSYKVSVSGDDVIENIFDNDLNKVPNIDIQVDWVSIDAATITFNINRG